MARDIFQELTGRRTIDSVKLKRYSFSCTQLRAKGRYLPYDTSKHDPTNPSQKDWYSTGGVER